jgi:hypothetical protein
MNTCRKFGISYTQYHVWLKRQNNRCAICQQIFQRTPCLDHDHETGKPRGFVCHVCNIILGALDKVDITPTLLILAQAYLDAPPLA